MSRKLPEALQEALSLLREVFARYPARELGACDHCVDLSETAALNAPLATLSVQDFGRYPAKAMTTIGGVEDYKHFLPRILELTVSDARATVVPGFSFDEIARKLVYAKRAEWPAVEQEAILGFLTSVAKIDEHGESEMKSAPPDITEALEVLGVTGHPPNR